jgi:hypothetical protein
MSENCGDCRFWKFHEKSVYSDQDWQLGFCRRHPPQFTHRQNQYIDCPSMEAHFSFPLMERRDWCGEFKSQIEEPRSGDELSAEHQSAGLTPIEAAIKAAEEKVTP